ncbi:hypothetical protein [Bradyrhizobium genosp. L]|uniref:hypothetical protein n=1 Tax=Bradyrhizobium genosp. L TaxID=83637 RepID=UPI001AEE3C04|nr:hypothetical protein [Bradyrhizobium genosp. L]
MKLIRTNDGKVGLFVRLAQGPSIIDVGGSAGVFAPHDPLSGGFVNGTFKDGCDWLTIIKHWRYLKPALQKLARIAVSTPDHPRLVLRPFTDHFEANGAAETILAIDVTDIGSLDERDPTGRRAMERQFANAVEESAAATRHPGVVDLLPRILDR